MRRLCALAAFLVALGGTVAAASPPGPSLPHEHPCDGGKARCGSVAVPLNRWRSGGRLLHIGYMRFPHTDTSRPGLETIVAIEGGPGYPTIQSRGYYLGLFRPMMDRHDLLLVDLRGTGTSGVIDCEPLQHIRLPYTGWVQATGKCGRQLGSASNLYSSADAADDLADVLDSLSIPKVDLYGDSYGTFFSQTFAIRHGDRLRALVLDAAYPVEGADPWWRDLARAAASGYRLACQRDAGCAAVGGDPVDRLARLARRVARHPITGMAPNADGVMHRVTIDPGALIQIYDAGGYVFDPYRELDAAVRAALAPHPDNRPLLRLGVEEIAKAGGGSLKYYSQGLASAVSCTDYPQLYDMMAPPKDRPAQYHAAIHYLQAHDPKGFYPFTVQQYISSPDEDYDSCLRWPVPRHPHPLLPPGHIYPHVPTLVLVGDLDSVTSAEGAQKVASRFPNATFVEVSNMVHVSALGDTLGCASGIVLRFVRTLDAGNTSCASHYPEIREVDAFATRTRQLPGSAVQRAAEVAADTVGDVLARWDNMGGYTGVGLRGGTFRTIGSDHRRWTLHRVRWTKDAEVSGHVTLNAPSGALEAHASLAGSGVLHGHLDLRWNTWDEHAQATVTGTLGGHHVHLVIPAP